MTREVAWQGRGVIRQWGDEGRGVKNECDEKGITKGVTRGRDDDIE